MPRAYTSTHPLLTRMRRPLYPIARHVPRAVVNGTKYHVAGRLIAPRLNALAVLWATDKAPGHHNYTPLYEQHLRSSRRSTRSVLEIGIGGEENPRLGGNSLYMWRNYFPRATIYGFDKYDKRLSGVPGIVALKVDQSDPSALRNAIAVCPPFDLIIDDGSHVGAHIITSFDILFPTLRSGGWYVIEDFETAYSPDFGGGPPGAAGTGVSLTKALLDDVHVGPRPVLAVHVYPGIAFIQKGHHPPVVGHLPTSGGSMIDPPSTGAARLRPALLRPGWGRTLAIGRLRLVPGRSDPAVDRIGTIK